MSNHEILFKKSTVYGYGDNAVDWLERYLSYRTQQVCCNGSYPNDNFLNVGLVASTPIFSFLAIGSESFSFDHVQRLCHCTHASSSIE